MESNRDQATLLQENHATSHRETGQLIILYVLLSSPNSNGCLSGPAVKCLPLTTETWVRYLALHVRWSPN